MAEDETTGDARVVQLARLTRSHLNHVQQQFGAEDIIKPGSPAATEQATDESGPSGPWGDLPAHTALGAASFKLWIARDHLMSLAKLLDPPLTLFGAMTMARASIEASSQAFWLLDPQITVRARVGRSLADRRYSADEQRKALSRLNPDWEPGDRGPRELDKEADELGVEVPRIPTKTELATLVLAEHTRTPEAAGGLYRYLCAMAHGTNYAAIQHLREVAPSGDSRSVRIEGHMPLEGIDWCVTAALGANSSAVDRAMTYRGLDRWAWDQWRTHVGKVLFRTEDRATQSIRRTDQRPTA